MNIRRTTTFTYIAIAILASVMIVGDCHRTTRADDTLAAGTSIPGWRTGVSRWNGSGYDTLPSNAVDLPQKMEIEEPPYIVPSAPGTPISNPFYQPKHYQVEAENQVGAENQRDIESWGDAQVEAYRSTEPTEESVSELVQSMTDPYSQTQTPAKPEIDSTTTVDASKSVDTSSEPQVETKDAVRPESIRLAQPENIVANAQEQPPLQQEVIRWYQYPRQWMKGWDSHAEFGIDGSDGNANTLAIQTGLELKRKTDLHTFALDIDYRQASSSNATTENNGRLNIDYDRMFVDSKLSAFGKFGLEWDRFKAFDLRLNLNGGLGYHWIRDDDASLVTRFGAGASREIGAPIDEWTPEAVFGIDAERQLNARNKLKGKLDYFPAWEDFGDYRLVADASWEILLDDSDNLSLKLAVTDRYDSTPQGAKPNDVYYSMLLLYKF